MVSPPFRSLSEKEDAAEVEKINASGATSSGSDSGQPKQENWMYDHRDQSSTACGLAVGAGLTIMPATQARARMWDAEVVFRVAVPPDAGSEATVQAVSCDKYALFMADQNEETVTRRRRQHSYVWNLRCN